jgi:aldehyde:ferredoxin oxidoreductase
VEPKAFPGMFTAYGTSNRGRGDHTYAWTVQAEESGLKGEKNLANYVAEGQYGKALVDSLGLCDFFTGDITSGHFLSLYHALTGFDYSKESMVNCGRRIYTLERYVNNLQGRDRNYDAYVPKKFATPLSCGAHKGHCIDKNSYELILDHYYERQGFTRDGIVKQELLTELGILE